MNRIPFTVSDIKKLSNIGMRLFRGLTGFNPENADKTREHMARVTGWNDFHELKKGARDTLPFPEGSITRADIRLVVASGLGRHWGVPLLEGYLRASRSRLPSLSVDQLTIDRRREESTLGQTGAPIVDEGKQTSQHARDGDQPRLLAQGAPSFDLAVWKDGTAFDWNLFQELYEAIRSSRAGKVIVDPRGEYAPGSPEAADTFLSEVLIPQSRIRLAQLIRAGLKVPNHEPILLFSEEGECMGKGIRHTAHGGLLMRLFLTEDEVCEGLSSVLQGYPLPGGSSLISQFFVLSGAASPVFTLKPGVAEPKAEGKPFNTVRVPIEQLELLPGVKAGFLPGQMPMRDLSSTSPNLIRPTRMTPGAWYLGGKHIRVSVDQWPKPTSSYLESVEWCSEANFPVLFPDYRPTIQPPARLDIPDQRELRNHVFLPEAAVDLQARAMSILERKVEIAHSWLKRAADAGVFANRCRAVIKPDELEQMLVDSQLSQIGKGGADFSTERSEQVYSTLVARFPELARYGAVTLNAALSIHADGLNVADLSLSNIEVVYVLKGVVMLQALCSAGATIEAFHSSAIDVAMWEWVDHKISIDQVYQVATTIRGYAQRLNEQHARIQAIKSAVEEDASRRKEAYDHGYAYVGNPLRLNPPLDLPRTLHQHSLPGVQLNSRG